MVSDRNREMTMNLTFLMLLSVSFIGSFGSTTLGKVDPFVEKPASRIIETPHYNDLFFLGQLLFRDKLLSGGEDLSCSSCHFTGKSVAIKDSVLKVPSLINIPKQDYHTGFWNGRMYMEGASLKCKGRSCPPNQIVFTDLLEAQIASILLDSEEMLGTDNALSHAFEQSISQESQLTIYEHAISSRLLGEKGRRSDNQIMYLNFLRSQIWFEKNERIIRLESIAKALAYYIRAAFLTTLTKWEIRNLSDQDLNECMVRGNQFFETSGSCRSCHSGVNYSDYGLYNFGGELIRTPTLINVANSNIFGRKKIHKDLRSFLSSHIDDLVLLNKSPSAVNQLSDVQLVSLVCFLEGLEADYVLPPSYRLSIDF